MYRAGDSRQCVKSNLTLCQTSDHRLLSQQRGAIVIRSTGYKDTKAGEREVQKALRKAIYVKYKIMDQDLFDKAFGYIRQYY